MSGVVVAESTGTILEAVATQEVFVFPAASRIAAATRYGVVGADSRGREYLDGQLFMSAAEAAEVAATRYLSAKVVKVFVEVSDV